MSYLMLQIPHDSISNIKSAKQDLQFQQLHIYYQGVGKLNGIGIFDDDILIVQKGMIPKYDDVIVIFLDGEFFVKKFRPKYKENSVELKSIKLKSENPQYSDLYVDENSDFIYWGRVTWNLHKL